MILALRPVEPRSGLAHVRKELGLTQAQVCRVSGVSRRTLQRLEARPQPPITPSLIRVMDVYAAIRLLEDVGPNGRQAA
jgi:transcriptional regulator with XRE-family HTH domain